MSKCTTWPSLPVPSDSPGAKCASACGEVEGFAQIPPTAWAEVRAGCNAARPRRVMLRPPRSSTAGPLKHRGTSGPLPRRCAGSEAICASKLYRGPCRESLQMTLGSQFWRKGICFKGDPAQAYQLTPMLPPASFCAARISRLCPVSCRGHHSVGKREH